MGKGTYKIVFEKLEELKAKAENAECAPYSEPLRVEIDEIAELRRLVLEVTDPEPTSYTTT
jgi:hypothetical protein